MKKVKQVATSLFLAGMVLTVLPTQAFAACQGASYAPYASNSACAAQGGYVTQNSCATQNACAANQSACLTNKNGVQTNLMSYLSGKSANNNKSMLLADILRNCLLTGNCN